MKNRKGQVTAFLTLGLVVLGTVIALGSSFLVNRNNIASNSRAAGCSPGTRVGTSNYYVCAANCGATSGGNCPSYSHNSPDSTCSPCNSISAPTTAPAPTTASSGTCPYSSSSYAMSDCKPASYTSSGCPTGKFRCVDITPTTAVVPTAAPTTTAGQNSGDVDAQGNPLPNGEINHCCFLFSANSRCNGGPTLVYWGDGMRCVASTGLGKVTASGHCSDLGGGDLSVGGFQCMDSSGNPATTTGVGSNGKYQIGPGYDPNTCQQHGYTNDLADNVFSCCHPDGSFAECQASNTCSKGLSLCNNDYSQYLPSPTPDPNAASACTSKGQSYTCVNTTGQSPYSACSPGQYVVGVSCGDTTLACCKDIGQGTPGQPGTTNQCETNKNDGYSYSCISAPTGRTASNGIACSTDTPGSSYTSLSCGDASKICCKKPDGTQTGANGGVQCATTPTQCTTGDKTKSYYLDTAKTNIYSDAGCNTVYGANNSTNITNYCAGGTVANNVQCDPKVYTCPPGTNQKPYYLDVSKANFYSDPNCNNKIDSNLPMNVTNYCAGLPQSMNNGTNTCRIEATTVNVGGTTLNIESPKNILTQQPCDHILVGQTTTGEMVFRECSYSGNGGTCLYSCNDNTGKRVNCDKVENIGVLNIVTVFNQKSKTIVVTVAYKDDPTTVINNATVPPGNYVSGSFGPCGSVSRIIHKPIIVRASIEGESVPYIDTNSELICNKDNIINIAN